MATFIFGSKARFALIVIVSMIIALSLGSLKAYAAVDAGAVSSYAAAFYNCF